MIKPLNETAKHVLGLLDQTNFSEGVRTYSGRGMSGRVCLSTELNSSNELFELGFEMARALYFDRDPSGSITPAPQLDNMGRGLIAYWPAALVEEMESQEE
jgi:hypothetical protein